MKKEMGKNNRAPGIKDEGKYQNSLRLGMYRSDRENQGTSLNDCWRDVCE